MTLSFFPTDDLLILMSSPFLNLYSHTSVPSRCLSQAVRFQLIVLCVFLEFFQNFDVRTFDKF